jgi:hypothetical protein
MKKGRIPAAEYPAFRELLARADRALQRTVRVGPTTAEARSTP